MSLLRRVENRNPFGRGTEDAPPPPPTRPEQTPIRELWHHTAAGKLFTVAMTRDSRFIIAGSQAGEILFFDIAGRLLWRGKVEGAVNRLAVAEDAECFLAGTIESGQNAYLWHFSGRLLNTFATGGAVWGVGITSDASLIAVGSVDKHLYGFNRDGEALFKQPVESAIRHLTMTANGEYIFFGSDDHHVYAFDRAGNQRWRYQTGGRVWAGVRVAEEAHVLVAGSNDGAVYGLDFDGAELWKFNTGGLVNNLAVTPDARLCAAAGQSHTVHLLNEQGNVLWEYQTGDHIYGLTLSPDGRFMIAGSNNNTVHLIDLQNGHRSWKHQTRGRVYGVAQTPNGQFFAAASADQTVYAFKNALVEDDPARLVRPASKPLMRLVVQRVREEYAVAAHAGLVRWFSEFEKSLRHNQFDACQALLDEVHEEGGIPLSEGEKQYTRSLEGVYWLFRGVAFHRHGQYADARDCYEKSKTIQENLNNQDGVGQVVAALSLLPAPADETTPDLEAPPEITLSDEARAQLDEIMNKPRVLGMSEKLLAQRLTAVPPVEQLQIILLAKQSGYITPLLKGLNTDERVIRAAASAALVVLNPGPDYDVLVNMLESAQPFVQWQALRMLRDRAYNRTEALKEAKASFWPAVLSPDLAACPDPLTRREAALLIKDAGDSSDTPWLLARLDDPDVDVQIAAAEALGAVGDRSALSRLKRVSNKGGFLGRDVGMVASEARNAIENRHPLPTIEQIVLCEENPLQRNSVRQSTLFMTDTGAIYGIVAVDHIEPGAQVTVKWLDGEIVLKEEQHTLTGEPSDQRVAEIQETVIVAPAGEQAPLTGRRPARRAPLGRGEPDGPRPNPFRRSSPFGQDDSDDDDDLPDLPRRRSPFERDEPAPARPSFFRDRVPPAPPSSEPASRPRPFGERPRPGETPNGPARPGFAPRSSPFGRRDADAANTAPGNRPRRVVDPNENVEPTAQPELAPASRPDDAPPPGIRPRSPFGSRFGGDPPASRPSAPSASREADLPPWLRPVDDQNDEGPRPGFFRQSAPATRPGQQRPPLGGFGRSAEPSRPVFGQRPRSEPSQTTQQFVVSLPRPEAGWKTADYTLEVTIDGESVRRDVPFKFTDSIKLVGLEAGVAGFQAEDFSRASTFLVGVQYVDCQAHLEEAPVNTRLTGRLYNGITGTVVAETVAYTQKQGTQAVQLSWENIGWQPGHYRIAVFAENGNELNADIDLVTKIRADRVVVCHQVDKNNGPIGTDWPFRPGDQCCCVVEFVAPPPSVEVTTTWYRKNESAPLAQARPYTTTAVPDQRMVSRLTFRSKQETLTPGHYSVVVEGKSLVREERTFEVLPYSRTQVITRAIGSTYQKISPFVQQYHLIEMIAVLLMTALLAGALMLAEAGLEQSLDSGQRAGDAILQVSHAISQPSLEWGLAWLAFGAAYAALHTRYVKNLGKTFESRVYEAVNVLLVFASAALIWYLAARIIFGAGYLWPDTLGGIFDKLLWLAPLVAWLAPLVGLGVVVWQQDNQEKPFHLGPVWAALGLLALILVGLVGALALGLPMGLLGAAVGGLLNIVGIDNHLGHGFFTVGAGAGFILGLISTVLYARRDDLGSFWKEWQAKKQEHSSSHFTLLTFIVSEDGLPGQPRDYLLAAGLAVRLLILMGAVMVALRIGLEAVVLPALRFLYNMPDSAAFDHAVTSAPLAATSAAALLLIWPVLVFGVYWRLVRPSLSRSEAVLARRSALAAAVLAGMVPIALALASRIIMRGDLEPEIGIFWVNRAAAVSLLVGAVMWWGIVFWKLPDALKSKWKLTSAYDEVILTIITILAGLLLPGWMWALLAVVAFITVGSAYLVQRIN